MLFAQLFLVVVCQEIGQTSAITSIEQVIADEDGHDKLAEAAWSSYQSALTCWGHNGKWAFQGHPRYLWPGNGELACPRGKHKPRYYNECGDLASRTTSLSYAWEPSRTCPRPTPHIRDFGTSLCGLKTGDIFVVGDSLSEELTFTLQNAITPACDGVVQCPANSSTFKLIGPVRNDYLDIGKVERGNLAQDSAQVLFYPTLQKLETVKTVILNRGAHFEPTTNYSASLERLFVSIRRDRPDVEVYFRNTPAGHPNCWNPPAKNKAPPLERLPGHGPRRANIPAWGDLNPFHWSEFAAQNEVARKLALKYQIAYLDVATATAMRQDSHCSKTDCLHYCIPGPIDMWVELFVWAVILRRSMFPRGDNKQIPVPQ